MRVLLIIIFFSVIALNVKANADQIQAGDNPIILIARISVKPGMVQEYMKIAQEVDDQTQKAEPGMIFHNFDAEPENPIGFTWSEIYLDSEALIFHLQAPYALQYVKKHQELADSFEIEIYGNLSPSAVLAVNNLGLPFKHFKTTTVGYIRENYFNKRY